MSSHHVSGRLSNVFCSIKKNFAFISASIFPDFQKTPFSRLDYPFFFIVSCAVF